MVKSRRREKIEATTRVLMVLSVCESDEKRGGRVLVASPVVAAVARPVELQGLDAGYEGLEEDGGLEGCGFDCRRHFKPLFLFNMEIESQSFEMASRQMILAMRGFVSLPRYLTRRLA